MQNALKSTFGDQDRVDRNTKKNSSKFPEN